MKKMIAIENIRVGEILYKSGEEFEIDEMETQRLIDLNAAMFANNEIEATTEVTEEIKEENEAVVGVVKEPTPVNKKGKKNE
jgi:hypothetical protein